MELLPLVGRGERMVTTRLPPSLGFGTRQGCRKSDEKGSEVMRMHRMLSEVCAWWARHLGKELEVGCGSVAVELLPPVGRGCRIRVSNGGSHYLPLLGVGKRRSLRKSSGVGSE